MDDVASLRALILSAFADVAPPPEWCLGGSREGEEPELLENAFKSVPDWRHLKPVFLDAAPDKFSSALSFFSDEAFRFYLPAYLLAALSGELARVNPVYHLTHGLEASSRHRLINSQRYGARTWFDQARHRFSIFNRAQRTAIAGFLTFMRGAADLLPEDRASIQEALDTYWLEKAG